jgi:hypothetical protein
MVDKMIEYPRETSPAVGIENRLWSLTKGRRLLKIPEHFNLHIGGPQPVADGHHDEQELAWQLPSRQCIFIEVLIFRMA